MTPTQAGMQHTRALLDAAEAEALANPSPEADARWEAASAVHQEAHQAWFATIREQAAPRMAAE